MDPLFAALIGQEVQRDLEREKNREYATFTRPDGTVGTMAGDAHSAPLPEGELRRVSHNHPGDSSLSLGDLLLLSRVSEMEAVGHRNAYVARRGTKYDTLQKAYDEVARRVSAKLAHQRSVRGYDVGPTQEELINRELARLGVIEYEERPIPQKKK
jgi:hypothetical protein